MPHSHTPADDNAAQDELRLVVERLSRRDRVGGKVIERAAILAEGKRSAALIAWLAAHGWEPEAPSAASPRGGGLHGRREQRSSAPATPVRYLLHP
ncbi:MAG: hypothetical protein M3P44_01340 [Actinomycetota bacterium]|nr:hypothetical protein [Actinomycetota bacterium]